jgi:hypothetical protein
LKNICRNILGNKKVENYSETAQELIASYSAIGCNMSLKRHFLHSHVGFSLKTWQLSPIKIAEGSIRISPKLKRDTVENRVPICWPNTAGVL